MEIRHCPRKICVLLYIEERRFFLIYFINVYSLYIGVFILYRNHFFFFSFPPAHSISVYRENNAFIYIALSRLWYFSLYIGKYCPFFSYISCHSISYRWFSIYKHSRDMVFSLYIQTINTFFFLYFAQIVNFCILPIYMILKTFFFFQFLPRIYVYLYIVKTLFFSLYSARIIYIAIFPIYSRDSFFLSQTLPRLVPSAHFYYIQTTIFSLVFAQYLSYIMYYSYIQNKHLFFSFFWARYLYIVKFLCFSYILKTIENVYFLIYRRFLFFFFVFPDI